MACVGQATDRWILQLSEEAIGQLGGAHSAPQLLAQAGLPLRVLSGLGIAGQLAAETVGLPETDVSHLLKASPLIEWFEKDKVVNAQLTPNDPRYLTNEQSALLALSPEDASNASLLRRVIDAPRAWDLSFGKRDAIVAVIDSGIDLNHVDLASNIWRNPLENPNNDLDDDGNGYVDDVKGFDFVDDDNDTTDENGHGTAVAGIIGAKGNNNVGIAGVNWNASILPVRYLNAENQGSVSDAIAAINYVRKTKQQGANIRAINASWGFYGSRADRAQEPGRRAGLPGRADPDRAGR
jgi:subtilisin family serine protease